MPPKRHKNTEPETAPAAKKHTTRSSTKKADRSENAIDSTPDEPKEIKSKSRSRSKSRSNLKSQTAKAPASTSAKPTSTDTPNVNTSTQTTIPLSITHKSLKNPIICQKYLPSASPPNTLTSPSTPTLIFTHGAGGTLSAPAVVNFCTGYSSTSSAPILAFQGSMNLAARVKAFHACIEHLESEEKDKTDLLLGGRSMGARAAVMAASDIISSSDEKKRDVQLILVSYPLKGPKDDLRDQILLDLPPHVKVLFVIGTKDAMCPLTLLDSVRAKMKAESWRLTVAGMDHGMHGKKEKDLGKWSGVAAREWVDGHWDAKEKSAYIDEDCLGRYTYRDGKVHEGAAG